MTFNKHVRLVVSAELGALLQRGFTEGIDAGQAAPRLLYVLADGGQLREAVEDGALPAADARFAGEAALDAYALPLLQAFIDERRGRQRDTPAWRFGEELARGIHPTGSYFERYLVRMFEREGAEAALARREGSPPYALGLRTAGLDVAVRGGPQRRCFEACSAIYEAATQGEILQAIFNAFEAYHTQACDRFGERHAEQVLASCWDGFRQAVGAVLLRFRPSHLRAEREWLAIARWRSPARFQLAGDVLVPALSLRAHPPAARALPIEHTLVHGGLPQPLAADSLRHYYRFHKIPARVGTARPCSTPGF
jgi:hypothetical protein